MARCFSFCGIDLPRTVHFAIGNFLEDALRNRSIKIKGDGTTVRSYLDQRDLADWLISIVKFGRAGEVYNVGSDEPITLADLARKIVSIINPELGVEVLGESMSVGRDIYVPSIEKIKNDLGVNKNVSLDESIDKVYEYFQMSKK